VVLDVRSAVVDIDAPALHGAAVSDVDRAD
jgi:hypothetical protein